MADDSYDIGMFPRQADQLPGYDWLRPDNSADNVNDAVEIITGSSGYAKGYGNPNIAWALRALRPRMVGYIKLNKFPGGVFTYPATIGIPLLRETGQAAYYQTLATRTQYDTAELALGGLDRWVIQFTNATEINPPSSLLLETDFGMLLEDGRFLALEG